jgi:putative membrane protein
MGWHGMDGWDWVWMTTMMVLFWGGIIAVVIVLVSRGGTGAGTHPETPEETLRHRFARGDIDVDEYQQRLDALRGETKR